MHHTFKLNDRDHSVELSRAQRGYRLHVGERTAPVNLQHHGDGTAELTINGERHQVFIATLGDDIFIHLDGVAYELHYEHPLERLAHQAAGAATDRVLAPMPGSLVAVRVQAGARVARGDVLLVMESMKMETTIIAPRDGLVETVHVGERQTFDRDALLVSLKATPPPNPLPAASASMPLAALPPSLAGAGEGENK